MKTSLHDSQLSEFSIFCWPEPSRNSVFERTRSSSLAKSKYKVLSLLLCAMVWLFWGGATINAKSAAAPMPSYSITSASTVVPAGPDGVDIQFTLPDNIECILMDSYDIVLEIDGDLDSANETLFVTGPAVVDLNPAQPHDQAISGYDGGDCDFTWIQGNIAEDNDEFEELMQCSPTGPTLTYNFRINSNVECLHVRLTIVFDYNPYMDPVVVADASQPIFEVNATSCTATIAATDLDGGSNDNCTSPGDLQFLVSKNGLPSTDPSSDAQATVDMVEGTDFQIPVCDPANAIYPQASVFLHVIDECGNESVESVNVRFVDNQEPEWSQPQLVVTLETQNVPLCPSDATPSLSVGDELTNTDTWNLGSLPVNAVSYFTLLSDNCTANEDLVLEVTNIQDTGDGCERNVVVTFVAIDECGNTSDDFQHDLTITDNTNPDNFDKPADTTAECDDDLFDFTVLGSLPDFVIVGGAGSTSGTSSVEDNCDDNPTASFSDVITSGTCAGNYTIARTWKVEDACGNARSKIQQITVEDNTAPVWDFGCEISPTYLTSEGFLCPEDMGLSLSVGDEITTSDNWQVGNVLITSLSGCVEDNCTSESDLVIRVVAITDDMGSCTRNISVTFEAEDQCGNKSGGFTCNYIIIDDTSPTVVETNFIHTITDTNPSCSPTISAASFDDGSTDNCDNVPLVYEISVDGGTNYFTSIDFVNTDMPDPTDATQFNLASCPKVIALKFRVKDNCGNISDVEDVTLTIEDDVDPIAVAANPIDGNGEPVPYLVDNNCSVEVTAASLEIGGGNMSSDNCSSNANLTYQVFQPGFGGGWGSSRTINQGFGPNSFNFDNGCPETVDVQYRVIDQCGKVSEEVTVVVTIKDEIPPTFISAPGPITEPVTSTGCTQTVDIPFPFYEDNCTGILDIDWEINALNPDGTTDNSVVFGNLDSALLIAFLTGGTPIFWDSVQFPVGTTTVRIRITDECGNETDHLFDVTIEEPTPVNPVCPSDIAVGTSHSDDIDLTNTTIDGVIIPSDGTSADYDCVAQVAWMNPTITLSCNLISLETTFSVPDPADYPALTLDCLADAGSLPATILHNTGALPFGGFPDVATFPIGTTEVTITSYFFGGDQVVCRFLVTVLDNEEPEITCSNPATSPLELRTKEDNAECPQDAIIDLTPESWSVSDLDGTEQIMIAGIGVDLPSTITDNCIDGLTLTAAIESDTNDQGTDPYTCPREIQIKWTVTDDADCSFGDPPLFDDCIQYIHVIDNNDPFLLPSAPTLGSDFADNDICAVLADIVAMRTVAQDSTDIQAAYDDNCTDDLIISLSSEALDGDDCNWTLTRVFDVRDECDNFIEVTITHEGGDQTDPIGTPPTGATGIDACPTQADAIAALAAAGVDDVASIEANYSDNCGEEVVVTGPSDQFVANPDGCSWSLTRIYLVRDVCENPADGIAVPITHSGSDQTPPALTGVAPMGQSDLDLCADEAAIINAVEASDIANLTAAFSDACGGDLTVSLLGGSFDSADPDDCSWTYVVDYSIADVCGNDYINVDGNPYLSITHTGGDDTPPTGTTPDGQIELNACANAGEIEGLQFLDNSDPSNPTTISLVDLDIANIKANYSDACGGDLTVTYVGGNLSGDDCGWTYTITYTVKDKCDNEIEDGVSITHSGYDQDAPTVQTIMSPYIITADELCEYTLQATELDNGSFDDCPDDPSTIYYRISESGAIDAGDSFAPINTYNECFTEFNFYLHVFDECNNEAISAQPVIVRLEDKTPPTLECDFGETLNANLSCGLSNYNIPDPEIEDNCSNDTSITSITIDNTDGTTNTFVGENVGLTLGNNVICYTVQDECGNVNESAVDPNGNAVSCCYTVMVVDSGDTPPEFSNCPGNQILNTSEEDIFDGCAGEIGWNAPEASDNCPNFVVSFTVKYTDCDGNETMYVPDANGSTPFTQGVHPVGLYEFTYTVTDGTSSDECEFDIEIVDDEDPTLTCGPESLSLLLDADGVTQCPQDATVEFGAFGNGDGTGTWTAADLHATFTVAGKSYDVPAIADNCTECLELTAITTDETTEPDNCVRILKVSFSLTDKSVATMVQTCTQTFTITEDTPPTITPPSDATVVECDGSGNVAELNAWLANNGGATATDNCSGVAWTNDFATGPGLSNDCGATGSVDVVFTATDECGNTSDVSLSFTIEDTTVPSIDVPASNSTVQCDGAGNATALTDWLAANGGAMASDICGDVTWSNDFTALSDDCGATGSASVTFTAMDDCGLTNSSTATFTIEDTTPPSIVGGGNMTVECGPDNSAALSNWLGTQAGATATDACGGVSWTNDYAALNDLCGSTGAANVTFTATDDCGLTSDVTYTFTIVDTTPPSIDAPAQDEMVECDGSGNTTELTDWLAANGGAVASDNCGAVTWTNDFTALSDDCGATGSAMVTFTATNECGLTNTTSATFTIEDNTDPTIDPQAADATVECDGAGNIADLTAWLDSNGGAAATDACGDVTWMNDFSGLSDECGETGSATVTFTATDECGLSSTTTATFTIEDSVGPDFTPPADPMLTSVDTDCNQFWAIQVPAVTDVCGLPSSGMIFTLGHYDINGTFVAGEFTNMVVPVLNASGNQWETNYPVGTTTGVIIAVDDCGNETEHPISITVFPPDPPQPPVCPFGPDFITVVGTSHSASIQGSNIDNTGLNEGDCQAEVAWMNPVVTNSCNQVSLDVIFTATTAPSAPDNITYGGGAALGGFPEISTFQLGCTDVSIVSTFTGGINEICSFTVCVEDDEDPIADCSVASDLELECGPTNDVDIAQWLTDSEAALLAAATDNCGPLSIDNDYADNAQRECVDSYALANGVDVNFTITDAANSVTCTKTIKIIDTLPPTIDTEASAGSAECDGTNDPGGALTAWLASNGGAAASDMCGAVTWSHDFTALSDDCGATGMAMVTFTATDECMRTASTSATFTIVDTTVPSIDTAASAGSAECDGNGNAAEIQAWVDANGNASASDACGSVSWTNDYVAGSLSDECGASGEVTVIFTATDECGLTSTTSATFTVEDTTDPTIDVVASDGGAECDGAGNVADIDAWLLANAGAQASDLCGNVTWSNDYSGLSDGCGATGSATVTFTATDDCGRTASTIATFTVSDTTAPVITCSSATITAPLDANGSVTVSLDTATGDILVDGSASGTSISIDDTCGDASFNAASATFGCADKGAQTLTINGVDDCGNPTADCVISIDVIDNIAPSFTSALPGNVTMLSVSTDCNENDNYPIPTATDNCPGDEPSFCSGAATAGEAFCTTTTGFTVCVTTTDIAVNSSINELAGEFLMDFPVGLTTVTFTVYDASCNPLSHSFDVIVQDQLVPFISLSVPCPSDAVLDNAPGLCEADHTWENPEFQDNCQVNLVEMLFDGVLQDSWTDASPLDGQNDANGLMQTYSFPVGSTTVTYNYFDASVPPNQSVCEFTVTVNDTEAPVLDCSAINATRSADPGVCTFTIPGIGFDPTWTDNCQFGGTVLVNDFNNTASLAGETFPVGTTDVNWTVTDPNGNSDTCLVSIVITDDEDPVITCPADVNQIADAGACGAVVSYTVGESDNCSATLAQTAGLASGSLFPVGTTTNTFTLSDAAGNQVTCSFDVIITDDEDPTITCPADVSQGVDAGVCGAVITYSITSSDNCPGETVSQSAGLASGSEFPVGTTTNTFEVTDASGNTATCSFDVTIADDEAPVAACADIDVFLDANGNASITPADVDGGSSDNCGVPTLDIDITTFDCSNLLPNDPGTVNVTLTATDAAGNTDNCTAVVTVIDNLPPVLAACQTDITIPALTGTCQNQFDWNHPTAFDNCDGEMLPNVPGTDTPAAYFDVTTDNPSVLIQFESTGCEALFPIGTTTVTHTYTDAQGNVGSCSFTVTVTGSGAGASPTAGFTSVVTDMMVAFTDASANATSWSWDFGDGVGSSTMQNPSYTYTTAGTYNVCLTVSNGCGEESTLCQDVSPTVGNPIVEPDLTPTITAVPLSLIGISTVYYSVEVEEIQGGDTDGSDITVLIPVDPRLTFTWDPAMTASGFATVDNTNWTYTNLGAFHKFTTSNVILGGNSLKFGFEATYDPQGTTGNYTTTTFLQTGSGGETVTTNNGDAEGVTYFQ